MWAGGYDLIKAALHKLQPVRARADRRPAAYLNANASRWALYGNEGCKAPRTDTMCRLPCWLHIKRQTMVGSRSGKHIIMLLLSHCWWLLWAIIFASYDQLESHPGPMATETNIAVDLLCTREWTVWQSGWITSKIGSRGFIHPEGYRRPWSRNTDIPTVVISFGNRKLDCYIGHVGHEVSCVPGAIMVGFMVSGRVTQVTESSTEEARWLLPRVGGLNPGIASSFDCDKLMAASLPYIAWESAFSCVLKSCRSFSGRIMFTKDTKRLPPI